MASPAIKSKPSASVRRKPTAVRARSARLTGKVTAMVKKTARAMKKSGTATRIPANAISLLEREHREVEALFKRFEAARSNERKRRYAARICLELRIHTQIEEEILYPPAYGELDTALIEEAVVEHASAKDLMRQIENMHPSDELYDAKMKVLCEHIEHHVKEEEEEMFPQLRDSGVDLTELARRMKARKAELLARLSQRA